jgi:glycosyltransferase involved in cell wall biosynthesis
MRIGFDAKRLYNNFTGLGNYSRFVVEALSRHYPDNQYILFTPRVRRVRDTSYFQGVSSIHTVTPSGLVQQLRLGSAWRSFSVGGLMRGKVDLFHGLSHELPRGIPSTVRKVVTVHDLIFYRYPQYYNPIDVAIYKKKIKHACRIADHIIAISEQTKQDVIDYVGITEERISVVYQGCHENFLKTADNLERQKVKEKYSLPQSYILYVGTIESRKNVLTLVKAFGETAGRIPHDLVLIGKATKYQRQIESYLSDRKIQSRVHIINQAAFDDLPAIYQQASVFVYPSLFEGFGIPIVEAMNSRVPVITSTGSCFAEAGGSAALYVSPQNEEMLAEQLMSLLSEDAERRDARIASGLEHVSKFLPGRIAADMMAVYERVLSQ